MLVCPECGEELWYDEEEGCWVCETCSIEFYEDEWEEGEWEDDEEEEGEKAPLEGEK
jgi:ribosomal protein L37AE/L43A